jgi:N-acetylneuraminic acid mutarotase
MPPELLEQRRLLAFSLNVNFQTPDSATPAGYVADTGKVYASRGNGYTFGWNVDNAANARDRNNSASPDQRYDTLTHTQYGSRTWELALPNGQYNVRIVGGDASFFNSIIRYNAENTLVVSGQTSSGNRFIEGSKTVTVSDGRLTISNASGASYNKICFIEISDAGNSGSDPTLSIAARNSSIAENSGGGAFRVTRSGGTSTSITVGYTIGGSAANGNDYDTLSGVVSIPVGASFADIDVHPKDDTNDESNETIVLTLKPLSGYDIDDASASMTITDNDGSTSPSYWPTSWSNGPDMPKARWEASGVVMDGKIWAFGGWMSSSTVGTQQVDVFNIATNTWTKLAKYAPVPHTHSAAAADPANHDIFFAGGLFGSYPGVPTNKAWKFDTQTQVWTELPSMPENHSSGAMALVNNQLHYIGGVLDDRQTNTGRHLVLNLNNLAAGWQPAPSMPDPRDHMGCVVLNGKIVIVGGEFGHDSEHNAQALVDQYDPATKTWSRLASLPIAKSHMESSTFVWNGKIISAGGQLGNQKGTDNVAMYDPAANKWTTIGKLPSILEGPIVTIAGNRVIVASGNAGTGPIDTTWFGELS